jgi:hypothetical protein
LCAAPSHALIDCAAPAQFLFIEFFIATYKRGAERRRKAREGQAAKKKR